MNQPIRTPAIRSILAVLTALCLPAATQAATIHIILSEVDVTYLGTQAAGTGAIYDSMDYDSDNLNPAPPDNSDDVKTVVFNLDGDHKGTLVSTVADRQFADLRINGVGTTLALNTLHTNIGNNNDSFGLDWFTSAGAAGNYLRLTISSIDNLLLSQGVFFFQGMANVADQNLPFGLRFAASKPVAFSYTATLPGINGSPARGAMGTGALTISGEQVPEPTTIGLVALASVIAAGAGSRRRGLRIRN